MKSIGMKNLVLISTVLTFIPSSGFGQTQTQMPSTGSSSPSGNMTTSSSYPSISSSALYSSKITGLTIYNQEDRAVGMIEDVVIGTDRTVNAYVVSVGGFLGMGNRYVAINPSGVSLTWDTTGKKWMAKMNVTADQLKAAPEFMYPR